jgi:hypothetical protein
VIQFVIMIGLFLIVFGIMWLGLHFSQYKKRSSGCCGGAHHHEHANGYSCGTCPDKDRKDFSSTRIEVENLHYTTGSEK